MRLTRLLTAGLLTLMCSAGSALCGGRVSSIPPSSAATRPGIIFLVGGIGGIDLMGASAQWVLPKAGVPHEVREWTWTHGSGHFLKDLRDAPHLNHKADDLADEILHIKSK